MKKIIVLIFFVLLLTGCTTSVEYDLEAAQDTINVFEEHQAKGCSVIINDVEHEMDITDNAVNSQEIGEYVIHYEAEVNDETYTCERVVFVVDHVAPLLTLLPGVDTIEVLQAWEDAGVVVSDNYDDDVIVVTEYNEEDFAPTGSISFHSVGTFEVKYVATDDSGNETSIIRYVHVIEGE